MAYRLTDPQGTQTCSTMLHAEPANEALPRGLLLTHYTNLASDLTYQNMAADWPS